MERGGGEGDSGAKGIKEYLKLRNQLKSKLKMY